MHRKSIIIVGCGDLGTRLGIQLSELGHEVYGVRRSKHALPEPLKAIIGDVSCMTSLASCWPEKAFDYVIYCLAASEYSEEGYKSAYVTGLQNVLKKLQDKHPKRVFFVSSTSVYEQSEGEIVSESTPVEPQRFAGAVMLKAEQLLEAASYPATVVRFAGIYGPGRERLIKKVRAGDVCSKDSNPISNRIHIEDCVGLLAHLIKLDCMGQPLKDCYIGVDNEPAPLREVTLWLAKQLGVRPVKEVPMGRGGSKKCSSQRIINSGYQFKYPSYRDGYQALLEND
ncbi:SDR family oxidoreductase [Zooshikella harenae]|uniref:SDR family oxidoreductase n=1 Tax=Zooshikella harenae TaxID=2827238 RepID=A0ABS5ZED0_9GAMM|nr:SDR family oxidoreductase [Zooshikella harenae]MBU2712098.1 SDR family oxidoreductase [Zooshikella harenae]